MKQDLTRLPLLLLLAGYAAACLLHLDRIPAWCTAVAAAALLWRWLNFRDRLSLPAQPLRVGIALLLLFAIVLSFRAIGGLAAGSALLVAMGAAKLLETRAPRDAVVVAVVTLVLVLAAALERQGLARLPLYVATGWLALAAIAALGSVAAAQSAGRSFRIAARTAMYALPLAALCFVLVPRLPGPLWGMPAGTQAQTGLSDEMSPGSISDLSISEDIAFRVRFDGAPPPPAQRYWRGPVLHDFDGYTWRRGAPEAARSQPREMLSPALRYHVMLEPQGGTYLFALDALERLDGIAYRQSYDGEVHSWRPLGAATDYDGISHLQSRSSTGLSVAGRRLDTRLPPGRNPRSTALARQLRAQSSSDADYAARVIDYFHAGGFEYSLTPPLLDKDSIDGLLFRTHLGYCGHYASAFVMLMRAADVPARVVTGYQGGSWNPVGRYYTVRQSDAHAWAEVWLDGQGWTRFDPTAAVAPGRLLRTAGASGTARAGGEPLLGEASWLRGARDIWEAAGGWWQEQVVHFNSARQLDLLGKLGLGGLDESGMLALLLGGGVLWTLLLLAWLSRREPAPRGDALARLWERFLALLARRGVAVAAHDGPDAIRRRARRQLPEAQDEIDAFAAGYLWLRYGGGDPADAATLARLKRRLSAIARATGARRRRRTAPAAQG